MKRVGGGRHWPRPRRGDVIAARRLGGLVMVKREWIENADTHLFPWANPLNVHS